MDSITIAAGADSVGEREANAGQTNCRSPPRELAANGSTNSVRRPSLIEREIQELRAREEELRLSDPSALTVPHVL